MMKSSGHCYLLCYLLLCYLLFIVPCYLPAQSSVWIINSKQKGPPPGSLKKGPFTWWQQEPEGITGDLHRGPKQSCFDSDLMGSVFSFLRLGVVFCQNRTRMTDRIFQAIRGPGALWWDADLLWTNSVLCDAHMRVSWEHLKLTDDKKEKEKNTERLFFNVCHNYISPFTGPSVTWSSLHDHKNTDHHQLIKVIRETWFIRYLL